MKIEKISKEMNELVRRLFPICRSITGNGVRETLKIIQEHIPIKIHEIPTGTNVFDWTIPKEWNIKDAYVKDEDGDKGNRRGENDFIRWVKVDYRSGCKKDEV